MKNYLLGEEIKSILVIMTANDELPMDMNDLDMRSIMEKAEAKLKTNKTYIKSQMINNIMEFCVVDDYADACLVLEILEKCDKENLFLDSVIGVSVVERFEYAFTVKSFLEHITPV